MLLINFFLCFGLAVYFHLTADLDGSSLAQINDEFQFTC